MELLNGVLFWPLAALLLACALYAPLRERLLGVRAIAALETRLKRIPPETNCKGITYWAIFALLLALGVFVRCYRFVELPGGLNQDGMMAGVEAFCLMRDGTDQYGTSWPTYFEAWGYSQMSTLYSYLLIPFIRVLGLTKFALRLPMLLMSVAMLPLLWDFARRTLGRGFALLVLGLAAVNPWHIMQSRWALEANFMPHMMLLSVYLLFLGSRKRRWALYLSMVCFGLCPYAYGVASFSMPFLLIGAAVYLVARGKVHVLDAVVCALLFTAVAGPYYYTMIINAFQLETVMIGPFTLPLFEASKRTNDIALLRENPYAAMLSNLLGHLNTWLFFTDADNYNALNMAGTMYRFMPPVMVAGLYAMWRKRRAMARLGEEGALRDVSMLLLLWMMAAVINGLMVGGIVNRNNAVFYPLIFFGAYGVYAMGKRLRVAAAALLAMVAVSFSCFGIRYFTDEAYQKDVMIHFNGGLYEALVDTWDWDYDYYYMTYPGSYSTRMEAAAMFAHGIDYTTRSEAVDLLDADGNPTGWYFTDRYRFIDDIETFELNPMECAVYIVDIAQKQYFDPEEFLLWDYDGYAVAYPRYWAE